MYASFGARWRARGDHSSITTPRQPLRSFNIVEHAERARAFWLSLLVFLLSLCVSVSRRFSSLPALCFRLCQRSASRLCRHSASRLCQRSAFSALVSGLVSGLSSLCRRSALVSASAQFSSLFRFCFISASATPLARRVAFYTKY